jgi:mxaJ protein
MCSRFPSSPLAHPAGFVVAVLILLCSFAQARDLRVCADPDNLPFSNRNQQGFENKIADIVARDLNSKLVFVWQRMGRGFVREYLNASRCDLLIGIPSDFKPVLTTTPYYRSTYVFVTRRKAQLKLTSLDDPALRNLKIGVQVLDEDYTPPATALARRGLQNEIVGFDSTGKDADSIVRAVADGKVDTAIVWGPLAGYFARNFRGSLELTPVSPQIDPPRLPFTFAISMGVRKGNTALHSELETVLKKQRSAIDEILHNYGVPMLPLVADGSRN